MTKLEAIELLAANVGQKICVAYRTAADGTLLHRREPIVRAAAPLMALGLAACAAHAPEIEHPGEGCRDPHGYEVDCDQPRRGGDPMVPVEDAEPETPESIDESLPLDPELPVASDVDLARPEVEVVSPRLRSPGGMVFVSAATMTQIEADEMPHDRKSARAARRAARRERRSR